MRHIPEEELHAYIDQALSRSQCVEIESHIAACANCRAARDGIAALRDRTTSLLAALAPAPRIPPSFQVIQARHAAATLDRRHRARVAAWAASIVLAAGVGYGTHALLDPPVEEHPAISTAMRPAPVVPTPRIAAPAATPAPAAQPVPAPLNSTLASAAPAASVALASAGARPLSLRRAAPPHRTRSRTIPARIAGQDSATPKSRPGGSVSLLAGSSPAEPATVELSSLGFPKSGADLDLDGIWRTVSWDNAQSEAGEQPARINGLPVMQVQVQQSRASGKPLMVVAQQLESGDVIRTIEGSVADVSQLLARRPATPAESLGRTTSVRRGSRMLVITGDLPRDSLRAMIGRLNAGPIHSLDDAAAPTRSPARSHLLLPRDRRW